MAIEKICDIEVFITCKKIVRVSNNDGKEIESAIELAVQDFPDCNIVGIEAKTV